MCRVKTEDWSLVVADFNADGKLDLAVTNQNNNTVSILAGNGNGTFQASYTLATGQTVSILSLADLNHVSWALHEVAQGGFDLVHAHSAPALDLSLEVIGIDA